MNTIKTPLLRSRTFWTVTIGIGLGFLYLLLVGQFPVLGDYVNQFYTLLAGSVLVLAAKFAREERISADVVPVIENVTTDFENIVQLVTEDNELTPDDIQLILNYYIEKYGRLFAKDVLENILEAMKGE